MVAFTLEQCWQIFRHYFENHGNVLKCLIWKKSDLGGYVNKQNYRIWGTENPTAYIEKPTHLKHITFNLFYIKFIVVTNLPRFPRQSDLCSWTITTLWGIWSPTVCKMIVSMVSVKGALLATFWHYFLKGGMVPFAALVRPRLWL